MHPVRVTVLAAVVCSALAASESPREARADASDGVSSEGATIIQVPRGGLVFRSVEGAAIARLRSEASGGVFELLDSHQRVRLRLSPTGVAGAGNTRVDYEGVSGSPVSGDDPGY
jgi:hypothetical protein